MSIRQITQSIKASSQGAITSVATTLVVGPAPRSLARRQRRGATFIEYAILAGIAVIIGGIILGGLTNVFNGAFSKVSSFVNNP